MSHREFPPVGTRVTYWASGEQLSAVATMDEVKDGRAWIVIEDPRKTGLTKGQRVEVSHPIDVMPLPPQ